MKLISDITNSTLKAEVIAHIKREAREALKENQGKALGIKTLSDVDDTLYCSGGKFPAGVDKRLPRRCLYPGVYVRERSEHIYLLARAKRSLTRARHVFLPSPTFVANLLMRLVPLAGSSSLSASTPRCRKTGAST